MQVEFWNGVGGKRWAAAQKQMDAVLAPFAEVLLDAAELPSAGVVVDVGCGCGATTLMVKDRAPGATAIGVDVSGPMLEVAREQAAMRGLDVRFDQADAATASVGKGQVDRVISRFGMMFFDDPLAAFTNFHHWLRPDGLMVTLVWDAIEHNPWLTSLLQIVRRHFEAPAPPPDAPGPFSLSNSAKLDAMLQEAGFKAITQRSVNIPMRVEGSIDEVLAFFRDRGPVLTAIEELDELTRDVLLADIRSFVVDLYDGTGLSLPSRSRLVRARTK